MAFWPLLSSGMLVRTGHTVLTWGITLVLFLHDTGELDTAPPQPTRSRVVPLMRGSHWVPVILRHIEISISISTSSSSVFLICRPRGCPLSA